MKFSIRHLLVATVGLAIGFALVFSGCNHEVSVYHQSPRVHAKQRVDVFYSWSDPDVTMTNYTRIVRGARIVSVFDESSVSVRVPLLQKIRIVFQGLDLVITPNPKDQSTFSFH